MSARSRDAMGDELVAKVTVRASRSDVFDLLRDVEGYGEYVEHVDDVTPRGDRTAYDVALSWWLLSYTARVVVTDLDPPARIEWRLDGGLDAEGEWTLEPTAVDDPELEHATEVTLAVRYDPDSGGDGLSLPAFVPLATVVDRLLAAAEREAGRVVARVVADLEGEPREAALSVEVRRGAGRG